MKHIDLTPVEKRQLELGKQLDAFMQLGYTSKRWAFIMSFFKGLATGFGVLVGSTLGVVLLLWILSLFNSIPFLSNISNAVKDAIQNR